MKMGVLGKASWHESAQSQMSDLDLHSQVSLVNTWIVQYQIGKVATIIG